MSDVDDRWSWLKALGLSPEAKETLGAYYLTAMRFTERVSLQVAALLRDPEFVRTLWEIGNGLERLSCWIEEAPEKLREALEDEGAIPHPSLSISDLASVLDAFRDRGRVAAVEKLYELHEALFADEAFRRELATRWRASRRGVVLDQVVAAHDAGLYFVSIPAALAQAEGILADAIGHIGRLTQKSIPKHIATLSPGPRLDGPVVKQFLERYFEAFDHGSSAPRFSRHAILHGRDITFGTKAKSLIALIWIDYLMLLAAERKSDQQTAHDEQ